MIDLIIIAIEGSVDRFCGRPRAVNPYSLAGARGYWEAWLLGWDQADFLLEIRGSEEAPRWLREAA
jgi:hypothetical protein